MRHGDGSDTTSESSRQPTPLGRRRVCGDETGGEGTTFLDVDCPTLDEAAGPQPRSPACSTRHRNDNVVRASGRLAARLEELGSHSRTGTALRPDRSGAAAPGIRADGTADAVPTRCRTSSALLG